MAIAVTALVSLTTILTTKQATNNGNNIFHYLDQLVSQLHKHILGIRWIIAAAAKHTIYYYYYYLAATDANPLFMNS